MAIVASSRFAYRNQTQATALKASFCDLSTFIVLVIVTGS